MKIIVGLGNPGEKYKLTRHNVGFMVVDAIAKEYSQSSWIKKFNGIYCKCAYKNQSFLVLKPQTFMNCSGKSIGSIASFYKLDLSDLIVIHDDLDLEFTQTKIKMSGGHAGHNGLKSINQAIGTQYVRIRIGIGRPDNKSQVNSYVLSNFTRSQNFQIEAYTSFVVSNIGLLLNKNFDFFLDQVKQISTSQKNSDGKKIKVDKTKTLTESTEPKSQNLNFLQFLFKK